MANPLIRAAISAGRALYSAREAALDHATLNWDDRLLRKGELPPELLAKSNLVLIYLLPRIFRKLGMPQAAQCNELWQHGTARFREALRVDPKIATIDGGSPYYWMFSWPQFSRISPTLRTVVSNLLAESVDALPRLRTEQGAHEDHWAGLRAYSRRLRVEYGGAKEWRTSSRDYRQTVAYPDIALKRQAVTYDRFKDEGEDPMKSDAFASIGSCAARAYLFADFRKSKDSDAIFMRPRRVGVRIWDDYNFRDNWADYVSGLVADGRASQFLGNWINRADGSKVTLHNSDFEEYRTWFAPRFNEHVKRRNASQGTLLMCTDYHPVSTWVERDVTSPYEYSLPPSW